jgi:hypothetical protein
MENLFIYCGTISSTIVYLDLSDNQIDYYYFQFASLVSVGVLKLNHTTTKSTDISNICYVKSLKQFEFRNNDDITSESLIFPESLTTLDLSGTMIKLDQDDSWPWYCHTNMFRGNIVSLDINADNVVVFSLSPNLINLHILFSDHDDYVRYQRIIEVIRENNMNLRTLSFNHVPDEVVPCLGDLIRQDTVLTSIDISDVLYFKLVNNNVISGILQNKTLTSIGHPSPDLPLFEYESLESIRMRDSHLLHNKNRNMTLCKLVVGYLSGRLDFIDKFR